MNCYAPPQVIGYLTKAGWLSSQCKEFLADRSLNGVYGLTGSDYALALALTILIEAPFYYFALRKKLKADQILFYMVVLNLATHPLVVLGLPQFFALVEQPKIVAIVVGEIFAPVFEGLMLWRMAELCPKKAFGYALLANLVSWTAGLLV